MDDPVAPAAGACLRCGQPLKSLGVERLRAGGTGGGWKLLFGEWAELGEVMLPFELLVCGGCRQVEWRVPTELLEKVKRVADSVPRTDGR